jgi:hypothetical protein
MPSEGQTGAEVIGVDVVHAARHAGTTSSGGRPRSNYRTNSTLCVNVRPSVRNRQK